MLDTIFALASGRGKAGVSVVRLSGPGAHSAVEHLTGALPQMRRAALRKLRFEGELLDEGLVLLFPLGGSFTGETCAELHVHGGIASVQAVLRALSLMPGLRIAAAGEFTRRALENGRLDLTQVEGLADLIDAETEAQRRQAIRVMSGVLGEKAAAWRRDLIRAAALMEATIDFADEDVPVDVGPEVLGLIEGLLVSQAQVLDGSRGVERVRDGFEVAIIGAPNAGKSTLLNALAGREAAITSEIAGTTRDVIEVRMDISGLAVTLLDTAGLRDAVDKVEKIGVSRAIERAGAADLRIFLLSEVGEELPIAVQPGDVVVLGKGDVQTGEMQAVSGKTGLGLDWLIGQIGAELAGKIGGSGLLIRQRHKTALANCMESLQLAKGVLLATGPAEVVAAELRQANHAIAVLVGRIDVEMLLDEVFSSFCIGK